MKEAEEHALKFKIALFVQMGTKHKQTNKDTKTKNNPLLGKIRLDNDYYFFL
jgi:hypothetical protein